MARVLIVLAGVVAMVSAQCAKTDNANCVNWVRNGFCTNPGYAKSMLQQYCPNSCTNSGCGPAAAVTTTTAAGPAAGAENANCKKWNEDPKNAFCATADPKQKSTFCATTCKAEVATTPIDSCAIYVNTAGKVVRTGVNQTAANDDTAVPTKATATDTLVSAYAKTGCTITLYKTATTPAVAGDLVKAYPGATKDFNKIDQTVTAEATAMAVTCKCP